MGVGATVWVLCEAGGSVHGPPRSLAQVQHGPPPAVRTMRWMVVWLGGGRPSASASSISARHFCAQKSMRQRGSPPALMNSRARAAAVWAGWEGGGGGVEGGAAASTRRAAHAPASQGMAAVTSCSGQQS